MFKKILVPLDGSELAEEAVPTAIELAQKFDGTLVLLTVLLNIPKTARDLKIPDRDDDEFKSIRAASTSGFEAYLQAQKEMMPLPNARIEIITRDAASPADGILDTCDECGGDAIVMSTHGRSGINRWVFGSVAEKVLRGSKVPVVLLPSLAKQQD